MLGRRPLLLKEHPSGEREHPLGERSGVSLFKRSEKCRPPSPGLLGRRPLFE